MQLIEMTVTNDQGKTEKAGTICCPTTATSALDPYRFYAIESVRASDAETITPIPAHLISLVMPIGGEENGLFRFPKVGDKVLVASEGTSYYLMGYLPNTSNKFNSDGTTTDIIEKEGELFRYKKSGQNTLNATTDLKHSEIGFVSEKTHWQDVSTANTKKENNYPIVDKIKINSTGDLEVGSQNYHQIKAKRLGIFCGCEKELQDAQTLKNTSISDAEKSIKTKEDVLSKETNATTKATLQKEIDDLKIVALNNDLPALPLDTPADDANLYAGDFQIRSTNRIIIKAGKQIVLKVGRSVISISEDGVSISSRKATGSHLGPWDSTLNITGRSGISMFGQNVSIGSAFKYSISDSFGSNISSIGGILRLCGSDVKMLALPKPAYISASVAGMVKYLSQMISLGIGMGDTKAPFLYSAFQTVGLATDIIQPLVGATKGWNASDNDADDIPGLLALYCGLIMQVVDALAMFIDMLVSDDIKNDEDKHYLDGIQMAFSTVQMGVILAIFSILIIKNSAVKALKPYVHVTYEGNVDITGGRFTSTVIHHQDVKSPFAGYDSSSITKKREASNNLNDAKAQTQVASDALKGATNPTQDLTDALTVASSHQDDCKKALDALGMSKGKKAGMAAVGIAVTAAALALYFTVGSNKKEADIETKEELMKL